VYKKHEFYIRILTSHRLFLSVLVNTPESDDYVNTLCDQASHNSISTATGGFKTPF
jgi:hypothetical protein